MPRRIDRAARHQQTRHVEGADRRSKYDGPVIIPEKKRRPARAARQSRRFDAAAVLRRAVGALAHADWKRLLPRLGIVAAAAAVLAGVIVGVCALVGDQPAQAPPVATIPPGVATQAPRNYPARGAALSVPLVTASPGGPRDLSFGAADIKFDQDHINMPTGIYDREIVFSSGSGSLAAEVMKAVYLYNLDTGEYQKIAQTGEYKGEIYETLVNHDWIVWLDTDHGTNNKIYVYDRNNNTASTNKKFMLQNNKNGKPKLRLYGNTLIYMERTSKTVDSLVLFDLKEQDQITLFSFEDLATYGVSAPCVYEDWVVWAGPLAEEADTPSGQDDVREEGEVSAIYYMKLSEDFDADGPHPRVYEPGTYVHDPIFNGEVFVWLDGNKSPGSSLYVSEPGGEPRLIETGVTTYTLGDGFVVYGKNEGVWVYIYDKGETCRLTSEGEKGILPVVTGRTVVWINKSAHSDRDVLRYIILSDQDLYPERASDAKG
ncbi:MAG: hypothetical protein ACOX7W_01000 [Christensenellales bacterium]|jgi:hypothetical protein